jgi:hypothetical protein
MKTTFALLMLAAVSLFGTPQAPAPSSPSTSAPAPATQPKKVKHHRHRKAGDKKPGTQKPVAPNN